MQQQPRRAFFAPQPEARPARQSIAQTTVRSCPIELDLKQLEQVAGGDVGGEIPKKYW